MTSASPTASRRHWSLFRATWPRSAPCSAASGSKTKGGVVHGEVRGHVHDFEYPLHAPSLADRGGPDPAGSAHEAVEETVQVGVRVTGQAAGHRSGLDDGGRR